jgi:hypothetical protein
MSHRNVEKCGWLMTDRAGPWVPGPARRPQQGFCRIYAGFAGLRRNGHTAGTSSDFVDSASIFQYSKDLARCCAWGLCGCWPGPVGGFSLEGLPATGHRLLDTIGPEEPEPEIGLTPRSPHPNRFVWQWVEPEARALRVPGALCAGKSPRGRARLDFLKTVRQADGFGRTG